MQACSEAEPRCRDAQKAGSIALLLKLIIHIAQLYIVLILRIVQGAFNAVLWPLSFNSQTSARVLQIPKRVAASFLHLLHNVFRHFILSAASLLLRVAYLWVDGVATALDWSWQIATNSANAIAHPGELYKKFKQKVSLVSRQQPPMSYCLSSARQQAARRRCCSIRDLFMMRNGPTGRLAVALLSISYANVKS